MVLFLVLYRVKVARDIIEVLPKPLFIPRIIIRELVNYCAHRYISALIPTDMLEIGNLILVPVRPHLVMRRGQHRFCALLVKQIDIHLIIKLILMMIHWHTGRYILSLILI